MKTLIQLWGLGGILLLLGQAVWRLGAKAWEPLVVGMTTGQCVAYGAVVLIMAYSEGYRGFQKGFSPRVVVRARGLAEEGASWRWLLAPLICMGLLHATRKRLIVSWSLTTGIVFLVVAVRHLEQPWRGIVDGGVVVGLSWGIVAMAVFAVQSWRGQGPDVPADFPDDEPGLSPATE